MPRAIAIRSAASVSPALPAAVKYRARLVPGSLYCPAPIFCATLSTALRTWSSKFSSRALIRAKSVVTGLSSG